MNSIIELLGLNLPDFLWHTFNFLILIFLIGRFFYRPVINMLDERSRRIRESLEEAERMRGEVAQADAEREQLLAETRREVQGMLTQATQTAERIQSQARQDAQQQAQRIVERAREEAEAERAAAMADLRREVASLAIAAAERVINQNLNDQAHRRLVEDFLRDGVVDGVADARR
ncbi:MAG: F0F1 ATP synthase subunit B [Chloroflexi bacterium]|nr:F0F1 ATP synthase subunit B [Chloroflexota bacterium]